MRKKLSIVITILLFSYSYSQCGQYIENKLSAISDIRFWDENNGFVIGGSSLLTTNNGGDSWQTYELPHFQSIFYKPLNDIELVDSNKAFVFGADGIILYTNNKGIDWERRTGISGMENFTGANFINSDIGYLVGINDYLINDTVFLYKTLDGGETWSEVVSNISSIDFRPKDVLFLDENIGFVWGGNLFYKTVNGGETWLEINNPSNSHMGKLQFVDSQTAYLSSGNFIFKTIDGGNSWMQTDHYIEWTTGAFTVNNGFLYYSSFVQNGVIKVNINTGDEVSANINQDGYLTDIYFINNNVGFAVGKKEQGSPKMGRFIYKTIDGGLNWIELDGGSPREGNSSKAIYFKKINENEYVYSVITGGNYNHSSVLLSQDKGASWKKVYETEEVEGFTLYAEGEYISHWRFSNPNNSGDGYIIAESYNKGTNWTDGPILDISNLPPDANYLRNGLIQASVNDFFLFGTQNLYHSTNKGITWSKILTPTDVTSKQFQFIDENNFIMYGKSTNSEPILYKTNNGGTSWDLVVQISGYSHNYQYDIFDFSYENKILIYPRYPGGKIFIYDIPNQNLIERSVSYNINKIKTIDDDSFIILDNNQNLYITRDNGLTWSQRFWANYNSSYPNIYVENADNIFLWENNFIQNLKKYIPSAPELIFGNDIVLINTEEEYIIPVDLFSNTEWILESGGTLILDNNTSNYKAKVLWETEGVHTLKAKKVNECGESILTEIIVTVKTELNIDDFDKPEMIVYPNPFNNTINISIPQDFVNTPLKITLINTLGQTVYKQELNTSTKLLELNNISQSIVSGNYFIRIESDRFTLTQKIIKQ